MPGITVRPFEPQDREAVRRLSYRLGYMGEPASWYWHHPETFADIWTAYYTDHEPESLFVAAKPGAVVGYLTGCVESRDSPSPARAIIRAALRHALFFRPGTARFLWRGLLDAVRLRGTPSGTLDDSRWPSHLHINLLPEARGSGAGARLMAAWFSRLAHVGSPGCHLGTLLENKSAMGFFAYHGFRPFGSPKIVPGMRSRSGGGHHLQFMVRDTPAA